VEFLSYINRYTYTRSHAPRSRLELQKRT
jgi:hypothetical protein